MRHLTDQELVSLYLDTNNERYFGQLYTRYRQLVYQKCLFFTGNADDSEDYVQDIFVRLTMKLRGFKGESKFTTWLHTVTANYCIDQLRKKQQHQTLWRSYMREQETLDEQNPTLDESYFHIFERVLNQLPHHQRELLLAKYEDGLQINELASKQDLTSSAIKMRIKRARDRARSLYDRIRMEEEC
ncbi:MULTISPECIES: RNA polymerase sigma factor [Spirosoma]|uniref:RNA polymerase sigma factor n=1 Tax=Spirosoma sordidisoli TaxID=2502893 RepID=A0A4Q2ULI3_9BACT|nr:MULTISPECIES: RNA polymerase sigma factor [Spirosoma]RYC69582.1 RNA polymerase sigma factor [Spirosoma sordidisoli]